MTEELDRLIADLDVRSGDYKRAWVDAALAQGDAIVPRLVAYLEAVVADPETFDRTRAAALGHLYALAVLTHAREKRAHDVVVALGRLEPDVLDRLLGDYLTEGLAGALAATSGGRLDGLAALMDDDTAEDFARGAAVAALALLAHTGGADRGAVLDALAGRLEREARHDYVNAVTVAALLDLHALDRLDAIRAAFEAERVDETVVGDWPRVEARFAEGPEPGARRLGDDLARELPADPHDILRGMYDLPDLPPPHRDRDDERRAQSAADVARRVSPKAAAKAKAKRKSAKGARKKQRRR
jgi:hypothetical protein